jgi:hypothetical protein
MIMMSLFRRVPEAGDSARTKGIYYHCEVIPVQKMLDINLTGIKYGLE